MVYGIDSEVFAMSMDKTTLYLPNELRRALKDAARRSGRAQADLVREALQQYLAKQPRPWPKSIGAGSDGRISAQDSEDWIREHWIQDLSHKLPPA
jgi:predicted transcriptional regulator